MKKTLICLLAALGLASAAFAGDACCDSGSKDKDAAPAPAPEQAEE